MYEAELRADPSTTAEECKKCDRSATLKIVWVPVTTEINLFKEAQQSDDQFKQNTTGYFASRDGVLEVRGLVVCEGHRYWGIALGRDYVNLVMRIIG